MGATLADEVGEMIEQATASIANTAIQIACNNWLAARDAAERASAQTQTLFVTLDAAFYDPILADAGRYGLGQMTVTIDDPHAGWTQARYRREIVRIDQALEGLIVQGLSGAGGILDEGIAALQSERRNLERGLVALRADRKATGQLVPVAE